MTLDSTRLQHLQQTPLWDFVLALYAKPGIEEACLTLQDDAGLDVCEVLFHCWLYSCGLEALSAAVSRQRDQRLQWQSSVTEVLRGLRRALKASAASSESVSTLRETIKQAELMAERENLQRWQAWALEDQNDEQRVSNIAELSQDSAKWLRKQLFLSETNMPLDSGFQIPSALNEALQTLTCQLDPHQGAR